MWALGVRPSALDEVYWSHTFDDLKTLVSLKAQAETAHHHQTYETFRLVVDEALGGGSGGSSSSAPSESDAVQTFDELARAFAGLGGTVLG